MGAKCLWLVADTTGRLLVEKERRRWVISAYG